MRYFYTAGISSVVLKSYRAEILTRSVAAQKMKFSIKDFFSK